MALSLATKARLNVMLLEISRLRLLFKLIRLFCKSCWSIDQRSFGGMSFDKMSCVVSKAAAVAILGPKMIK